MRTESIEVINLPHDHNDHFHNDLIKDTEEVNHDFTSGLHIADKNTEGCAESDDSCKGRAYIYIYKQTFSVIRLVNRVYKYINKQGL